MQITQKQIARKLGLHPSTVCMALKNHARIPPETRERILTVARELGYERDPMLGALAAYRRANRPATFRGVLAWLVSTAEGQRWDNVEEYCDYHDGACVRAKELGYKVTLFDLKDYENNLLRLAQVLRARNIRGAFVCPQPQAHTILPFDFRELAAVAFGYTVLSPVLHAVTSHHHKSVVDAFQQLKAAGCQRIGFAIPAYANERVQDHLIAGYLVERNKLPARQQLAPCLDQSQQAFRAWLRKMRPDGLITVRYHAALKLELPRSIRIAVIGLARNDTKLGGIDERSFEIGRVAAEFLISSVERGDRGLPATPQRILVNGRWRESAGR